MSTIPCLITGPASASAPWAAVALEGRRSALALHVSHASWARGVLRFELLVGYRLSAARIARFTDVARGLVLTVDAPDEGAVGALGLLDPDRPGPAPAIVFNGPAEPDDPRGGFLGHHIGLTVEVGCPEPSGPGSRVFLRARLQELNSSPITLSLHELAGR